MAPAIQAPGMAMVSARGEDIDLRQCMHYAQFASNLDRWHFDFLYWILFATNIFLLSLASFWYSRYVQRLSCSSTVAFSAPNSGRQIGRATRPKTWPQTTPISYGTTSAVSM